MALSAQIVTAAPGIAAVGGYLLGSIPFGLVLTRMAGLGDIRAIGSGNIGATNVLRTGRKDLAAATFLLDAGKAAIAFLIFAALFGRDAGYWAGGAAFVGHCFPVWLKFQGGKGVASFFGLLFAAFWVDGVIAALIWLAVAFVWRFSSLAGLAAAAAAFGGAFALRLPPGGTIMIGVVVAVIFWRHRANIGRLLNGTEPRIGAGKSKPADA